MPADNGCVPSLLFAIVPYSLIRGHLLAVAAVNHHQPEHRHRTLCECHTLEHTRTAKATVQHIVDTNSCPSPPDLTTLTSPPSPLGALPLTLLFSPVTRFCLRSTVTLFCLRSCLSGPFETGKPLSGGGIGLVKAASSSSKLKEGDVVSGMMPWSTFFLADAAAQVCGVLVRQSCSWALGVEREEEKLCLELK